MTEPLRVDPYTFAHKGQRQLLCELLLRLGRADSADLAHDSTMLASLRAALHTIEEHGLHEEQFLHPVIARVLPGVVERLRAEHHLLHAQIAELRACAGAVACDEARLATLYKQYASFLGNYFCHLQYEESCLPDYWASCDQLALERAVGDYKRERGAEGTRDDLALMLPAMNRKERAAFLERLRTGAPPAVYALALEVEGRLC